MVKYQVLLNDKPTESFDGVLQLLRYSKREEYLSMEYREVPNINEIDIKEKIKAEVYELGVSHEEMRKIRDFLNSLDLED